MLSRRASSRRGVGAGGGVGGGGGPHQAGQERGQLRPLRAKSFVERERRGETGATASERTFLLPSSNSSTNTSLMVDEINRNKEEGGGKGRRRRSMESSTTTDMEEEDEEDNYVERLEANVQRLADKCAALESQNILVAVQQLDLFAQYFSLFLSLSVLYGYWKFMGSWLLPRLLHQYLLPFLVASLQEQQTGAGVAEQVEVTKQLVPTTLWIAIAQNSWTILGLQVILLAIPYLYNRWTYGSMHRRFQVFVVAFIVIIRVKMCRWRENKFLQEDDTSNPAIPRYGEACTNDGIWEANYEISARFLYLSILRLRGLWTKTAQYLSSRADFVPVSYIRELSKLQDQAPATPWDQVERLLSKRLMDQLTDFEQEPLASASIGQVHVAMVGNRKVVVKVQHPHARTLMMDDFRSLKILTRIIGWLEPEFAFMEILMDEWAQEAVKELDFSHEAAHLREASQALHQWIPTHSTVIESNIDKIPFQVEVPEPMEELSSQKVLVMNFCEGCRIDDFAKIEEWGLSRTAVIDGVAQAFAHFMYCSTIFNGDPHAGNLLVRPGVQTSKEGFTIVVLDWGLAKRLPESKRLAFCQMVYAAATVDYGLLLDSYKTVGLKMKRENAGQSMEDMRFFLRDMAPREVARKRIKAKMKQGEEIRKKTNEKVPMESKAYPGEFFFFIRVNELLHGLGSRFGVNLGYLDALSPYAEKGIRMSSHYNLPKQLTMSPPNDNGLDSDLSIKLQNLLKTLEGENNLVGGQVYIIKDGKTQVDVVAGSLGGLKSDIPMRRDALVLGFSATKAVTATMAHLMVQLGYLSYDEPICEQVWKEFCPTAEPPAKLHVHLRLPQEKVARRWQWKREITLRHLLNHTAGLSSAFPAELTIRKMASCEACYAGYEYILDAPGETVLPTNQPDDGTHEYHFMSFGWLVAGTLCGAYTEKHGLRNKATLHQVYEALLEPKLSEATRKAGFLPFGGAGSGHYILAQTTTADIRASQMVQRQREMEMEMENGDQLPAGATQAKQMMQMFQGKEFLVGVYSPCYGVWLYITHALFFD